MHQRSQHWHRFLSTVMEQHQRYFLPQAFLQVEKEEDEPCQRDASLHTPKAGPNPATGQGKGPGDGGRNGEEVTSSHQTPNEGRFVDGSRTKHGLGWSEVTLQPQEGQGEARGSSSPLQGVRLRVKLVFSPS